MPTILLIDKGNNTNDLLRQVISEIDYVLMAEGPEVALYKLGDSTPDLIILDLGLRAPDSALICRRLRAIPRFYGAPILALTTLASPGDIARVLDAGADDCLRKPLVLRELGARIRALMRRPNRAETYTWITLVRADKAVLVRDEPVELTPTGSIYWKRCAVHPANPSTPIPCCKKCGTIHPALVIPRWYAITFAICVVSWNAIQIVHASLPRRMDAATRSVWTSVVANL
ncbi:MAG: response regulator [Anaerolineae bacterium]